MARNDYLLPGLLALGVLFLIPKRADKPMTSNNPTEFLSLTSIQRRSRQGIIIVENDLPVTPLYIDSVKSTGVKVLNRSKWFNAITIETSDILLLSKVLSFPFVKSVDPVIKIIFSLFSILN